MERTFTPFDNGYGSMEYAMQGEAERRDHARCIPVEVPPGFRTRVEWIKNKLGQPTLKFWVEPDPAQLVAGTVVTVPAPETPAPVEVPMTPIQPTDLGKAMADVRASVPTEVPITRRPHDHSNPLEAPGAPVAEVAADALKQNPADPAAAAIAELKAIESLSEDERRTIAAELGISNRVKKGQPAAQQAAEILKARKAKKS